MIGNKIPPLMLCLIMLANITIVLLGANKTINRPLKRAIILVAMIVALCAIWVLLFYFLSNH